MSVNQLSDKQLEIYRFILDFTRREGYPPSVREIGAAVGLRSPSTVHSHLKALDHAGLINRQGHKMRAIRSSTPIDTQWQNIPLLGRVTAGRPILAIEDVEGYVPFDTGHMSGDFIALRVRGDSMINAGILDGDIIIVRRQEQAEHREIVVAMLGEEATVKRLYIQSGQTPYLMPENDAYSPIDATGARIIGKVVGLYRDMRSM